MIDVKISPWSCGWHDYTLKAHRARLPSHQRWLAEAGKSDRSSLCYAALGIRTTKLPSFLIHKLSVLATEPLRLKILVVLREMSPPKHPAKQLIQAAREHNAAPPTWLASCSKRLHRCEKSHKDSFLVEFGGEKERLLLFLLLSLHEAKSLSLSLCCDKFSMRKQHELWRVTSTTGESYERLILPLGVQETLQTLWPLMMVAQAGRLARTASSSKIFILHRMMGAEIQASKQGFPDGEKKSDSAFLSISCTPRSLPTPLLPPISGGRGEKGVKSCPRLGRRGKEERKGKEGEGRKEGKGRKEKE
ncbi:hypothetical protein L345_04462, partial [Ophiophagus hannah]